jgi:hypothetical protein
MVDSELRAHPNSNSSGKRCQVKSPIFHQTERAPFAPPGARFVLSDSEGTMTCDEGNALYYPSTIHFNKDLHVIRFR